ncbi:RsmB/NOP family class I SAM-dependent RNA methyltransferase [Rhizorhabdus dicambivorans]|uniref:SAM-dependent methyltransferase n=1 Tax=Rhizorhabdus dicambivorans TaxID=1850238 RepID=A0A2A4FSQ3_9SPHN|nr:RsmB/NOP family class I SAM-dependent RNA methyltransferase [Rhizorhabdus dicambivorans]ATE63787.1 SAM-dependent methyltransferase [Rhizorhabdus dicambivorans]PCE40431.1 SAM-dependent methyltransferase [Rhizorhabdus dicambivorans]
MSDPTGTPTRRAALRLLDAVLRRGLPLEAAMDGACAELDRGDDRAFAHAIAAEVLRRTTDLDTLIDAATERPLPPDAKARMVLRIALVQALAMDTPQHAAIATVLPLVDGGPRKLVHGVFATVMRDGDTLPQPPHLPPAIADRWTRSWGKDAAEAARLSLAGPAPVDLTLKPGLDTAEWAARLEGESLAPGHVRIAAGRRIVDLPGYDEGAWWVQDIAASIPARLLGAGTDEGKGGRRALDLCAAPGGKTMQLAAAGWAVTAVDLSEARMERLAENLERTRLAAETRIADAATFDEGARYDAVLLDAPCSATGIFRRHPDVLHRAGPRIISDSVEVQARLIDHAAGLVAPGGRLVYAVCSLEADEGEQIAKAFLARQPGWAIDPAGAEELPEGIAPDKVGRVRIRPGTLADRGGADGFFVARFRHD